MLLKILENYTDIEGRIQASSLKFSELEKPNIAAIAYEHNVPEGHLLAHAARRPS